MDRLRMNRNQIKYLVIIAMLIDHIAWGWVGPFTPLGQVMHLIGRLTGPTMAFFVAEGYIHTRDVKKYALRLAVFALLSWPAFSLFEYGVFPIRLLPGEVSGGWSLYLPFAEKTLRVYPYFGVGFTLLLSLLAIWLYDAQRVPLLLRFVGVLGLIWLSKYGDWFYFDPLWALGFFAFRDRPVLKWVVYCAISALAFSVLAFDPVRYAFQLGIFLVPVLLIFFYNGQSGSKRAFHKWFFYVFYPVHLLLLAWLRYGADFYTLTVF